MSEMPEYEITHGDAVVKAVVFQVNGKTVVQPLQQPVTVSSGNSFTITGDLEDLSVILA